MVSVHSYLTQDRNFWNHRVKIGKTTHISMPGDWRNLAQMTRHPFIAVKMEQKEFLFCNANAMTETTTKNTHKISYRQNCFELDRHRSSEFFVTKERKIPKISVKIMLTFLLILYTFIQMKLVMMYNQILSNLEVQKNMRESKTMSNKLNVSDLYCPSCNISDQIFYYNELYHIPLPKNVKSSINSCDKGFRILGPHYDKG